jgi:hypothetical protein
MSPLYAMYVVIGSSSDSGAMYVGIGVGFYYRALMSNSFLLVREWAYPKPVRTSNTR